MPPPAPNPEAFPAEVFAPESAAPEDAGSDVAAPDLDAPSLAPADLSPAYVAPADLDGDAEISPRLDDASARFESALARLEALVEAGPLQSDLFRPREPGGADPPPDADIEALKAQCDAGRARERALEAVAAEASHALGRAMAEVRHALEAGGAQEQDIDEDGAGNALDPTSATPEDAPR